MRCFEISRCWHQLVGSGSFNSCAFHEQSSGHFLCGHSFAGRKSCPYHHFLGLQIHRTIFNDSIFHGGNALLQQKQFERQPIFIHRHRCSGAAVYFLILDWSISYAHTDHAARFPLQRARHNFCPWLRIYSILVPVLYILDRGIRLGNISRQMCSNERC